MLKRLLRYMFTPFMCYYRRFAGVSALSAKLDALNQNITNLQQVLVQANVFSPLGQERNTPNEKIEPDVSRVGFFEFSEHFRNFQKQYEASLVTLTESLPSLHTKLDQAPFSNLAENIILLHDKLDNGPLAYLTAMSEKLDILLGHTHSAELTDSRRKLDQAALFSLAENIISLHGKLDNGPLSNIAAMSEKLDILLHHRHATERTNSLISREVNRLDDYLNYHFEVIESRLDSGVMSNIVSLSEKLDVLIRRQHLTDPMDFVSSPKSSA